jgi:hypothetical protein
MERFKIYLLILFAVAHILISIFTIVPGYLSIDEATYHLMAKNFSESGNLEIWNGYREFPSPELESKFISARKGRLVSQYPYLYSVLCFPFFRIWGYRGLFVINAIAFLGIMAFCYIIAKKLFNDKNLAFNACFVLLLATFSWEYSQAAWPHATQTLFIMAGFYLCILSSYEKKEKFALSLAFASGLITGFAVGIRLDSIFVLPCILLSFFFLKPNRPWLVLAVCIGTLPGLLILSTTNLAKFGFFSPLSYGRAVGLSELKQYLPFAGIIVATFIVLWILRRSSVTTNIKHHKRPLIFMIILMFLVLSMVPGASKIVIRPFQGAYQLLVDFRVRSLDIEEGGLTRSSGGGMVYMGGLKKSLLQSCPYLVVLLFPIIRIVRRSNESFQLILLFMIPIVFISFYSYHNAWHGGLCLNLRYFFPILPFTSILTAYALGELSNNLNWRWKRVFFFIIITTGAIFLFLYQRPTTIDQEEFPFLTVPLLIALTLIIFLIGRIKFAKINRQFVSRATLIALFAAMVWSGLVAYLYDYTLARRFRQYNFNVADNAAKIVSNNSILFTNDPEPFFGLVKKLRDFKELIAFHLQKGHSVYAAFNSSRWEDIKKRDLLDSFKVIPIELNKDHFFSQIKF